MDLAGTELGIAAALRRAIYMTTVDLNKLHTVELDRAWHGMDDRPRLSELIAQAANVMH